VSLGFQTDTTKDNVADADSASDVKRRMTRSDGSGDEGNQMAPGFWPARGRRGNYEEMQPPLWKNSEKSRILLPYWRSEDVRKVSELWHNMFTGRLKSTAALPIRNIRTATSAWRITLVNLRHSSLCHFRFSILSYNLNQMYRDFLHYHWTLTQRAQ